MPWEKQFDVDEALTRAMQAFWARGYEATSMQDLVAQTGINRASIYATFGDKRSLFLQALRHYDSTHREQWLTALGAANGPKEAILAAFEDAIKYAIHDGGRDGCFLVNTALERSPHDPEIAAIVAAGFQETEDFFRRRIQAAQRSGDIPKTVKAAETACALLSLFIGLRVLSRSRPEERLLRSIAQQAAALLG